MPLEERPLLSNRCQKANVVARHVGERLTEMSDSVLDAASVTFEVDRFRAHQHLKGSRLRVQKLRPAGQYFLLRDVVGRGKRSIGSEDVEHSHAVGVPTTAETRDT